MGGVNNMGFSNMAVTASAAKMATGCDPVMPSGAKGAVIVVQTAAVAYRMDGTAPVAVAGSSTVLNVGDVLTFDSWSYPGHNWRQVMNAIQFIENTATDGVLSIEWFD